MSILTTWSQSKTAGGFLVDYYKLILKFIICGGCYDVPPRPFLGKKQFNSLATDGPPANSPQMSSYLGIASAEDCFTQHHVPFPEQFAFNNPKTWKLQVLFLSFQIEPAQRSFPLETLCSISQGTPLKLHCRFLLSDKLHAFLFLYTSESPKSNPW